MQHAGSPRFTDYDPFAWIYDKDWGAEYHAQAMDVLRRALLGDLPPPARILDLCCGNGQLTEALLGQGYAVTGLDGSEEMLRYARARAPAASLILADARTFDLPPHFDAVVSTFDSLNHIMSTGELHAVFRNVHRCLKPGGRFVFDLNRESAYTQLWVWPFTKVEDDRAFIARGVYDMQEKIATCDVTVFRQDPAGWQRSDFTMIQKCHDEREVERLLGKSGFTSIERMDAQLDLDMHGGIGFGRVYFRASRPYEFQAGDISR